MPIKITRTPNGYVAEVSPPHGGGRSWSSGGATDAQTLIDTLLTLGCHQTDIGDAFHEANPGWLERD